MDVDSTTGQESEMTILKNEMLVHLSNNNDIVFKSQQIGDPDLSIEEKRGIAEEYLRLQPIVFLNKFGMYLSEKHLEYFISCYPESDEVMEYANTLKQRIIKTGLTEKTIIRNRRLEAMKRLCLEGEYFSAVEMKKRNPLLYQHLVGKYLTDDERRQNESFNNAKTNGEFTLSGLLMEQMERDTAGDLYKAQEEAEENAMEEDDSDNSVDYDDSGLQPTASTYLWGEKSTEKNLISYEQITAEEKQLLMEEFRSHMYNVFLNGHEKDFDYSTVDGNEEYDDLDEVERDEQEKYFDSENANENPVNMHESDSSVDPLDTYMDSIEYECSQQDITSKLKSI